MKYSRILWNAPAYDRQIDTRFPMNRPRPVDHWIGQRADARSGDFDVAREAIFYELQWEQLMIPAIGDVNQTGWYGANGWREFLIYARDGNPFKVIPDRNVPGTLYTVKLIEAVDDRMDTKGQFFKIAPIRVRNTVLAPIEI